MSSYVCVPSYANDWTTPFNFEPCAPPNQWRLELRFYYLSHLNLCKFDPHNIQSYEERKPVGVIMAILMCAIFIDSAFGSLRVSFVELYACRGVQV